MASTVEEKSTSSSDAYKSRYFDYEKVYMDTFPEPPEPPEPAEGTEEGAAAKTALTRQQRYNDKKTTSTVKPNGGRNARDSQS
jgi:hypothetical protein